MSEIYFIRCGTDGPIKIGWTANLKERLANLQSANPAELVLLGSRSGTQEQEKELHARFASQRLRGEWFSWSLELEVEARGGSIAELKFSEAAKLLRCKEWQIARLVREGDLTLKLGTNLVLLSSIEKRFGAVRLPSEKKVG